jgi:hypothetical protein
MQRTLPDMWDHPSPCNLATQNTSCHVSHAETALDLSPPTNRNSGTKDWAAGHGGRKISPATSCQKCLEGKASELEQFMCSLSQMTTGERKQSIMTTLALLMQTDTILRHRGYGLRQQFNYYLPVVGHVYREAWCSCYGLSTPTLTRYRNRIKEGAFSVKAHGNRLNQNASAVDLRWLVAWFKEFSATVGDVVPVRVRKQKTVDGR